MHSEGEIEALIFLRHSAQAEKNNEAHGMSGGGAAIVAQAHQRILQQRSLNKMAARSA